MKAADTHSIKAKVIDLVSQDNKLAYRKKDRGKDQNLCQ
jgi:hypothetical protein